MANKIIPLRGSLSTFTITLASLASSTTKVGRQSTMVDLSTTRPNFLWVSINIMTGTTPTAGRAIYVYAIRSDKDTTAIRDDSAGASDAAWTQVSADYVYYPNSARPLVIPVTATSNVAYKAIGVIDTFGSPEAGIGVVHDTAVNLNSTGGNHVCSYRVVDPEIQ